MYFASRAQAGRMLAAQLVPKYRYENCAILCLSDGGVVVGAQIAAALHCVLSLLLIEEINLPREPDAIAGITSDGTMSYNPMYSTGELDDLIGEYHHYIEQEKMNHMHNLNRVLGKGSTVDRRLLVGRNVILVSDGLSTGFPIDVALTFLKPMYVERIIAATPLASIRAVDKLHVSVDEIHCLSVVENYMTTDHYYDQNDVPNHESVVRTIQNIILHWA